jgi:hypothetical protein
MKTILTLSVLVALVCGCRQTTWQPPPPEGQQLIDQMLAFQSTLPIRKDPTAEYLHRLNKNWQTLDGPCDPSAKPEVQELHRALQIRFLKPGTNPPTLEFLTIAPTMWTGTNNTAIERTVRISSISIAMATNYFQALETFGVQSALASNHGARILSVADGIYTEISNEQTIQLLNRAQYEIILKSAAALVANSSAVRNPNRKPQSENVPFWPAVMGFDKTRWLIGNSNSFTGWFLTVCCIKPEIANPELIKAFQTIPDGLRAEFTRLRNSLQGGIREPASSTFRRARFEYDDILELLSTKHSSKPSHVATIGLEIAVKINYCALLPGLEHFCEFPPGKETPEAVAQQSYLRAIHLKSLLKTFLKFSEQNPRKEFAETLLQIEEMVWDIEKLLIQKFV